MDEVKPGAAGRRVIKVRFQLQLAKHLGQGPAPNRPAAVEGVFGNGPAVAVTPDPGRKFSHLDVALRIPFEARRSPGRLTNHDQAVRHEFRQPPEQDRRHRRVGRRQDEHAVTHAAVEHQPPVLHRGVVKQHVRVDGVVVVTCRQGGIAGAHFDRRAFAAEISGVGHEAALLEQVLAAGDILEPRAALLPPGAGAIEVCAPLAHGHAGPTVGPRLQGITMEDEPVAALAEDLIAQCLE